MKELNNTHNFWQDLIIQIADEVEKKVTESLKEEMSKYSVEQKIPPYLNTTELKDLTGIGYKKQSYLRDNNRIAFSQDGRSITYKREDVIEYLDKHRIPMKAQIN